MSKNDKNKKREDKIFNNRYNSGDGLVDPMDYEFGRTISVDSTYSNNYLKDVYDYENSVEYKILLDTISKIVEDDKIMSEIIKSKDGTRSIFNKDEINIIFERTIEALGKDVYRDNFSNPIYVLEAISNITAMNYKKIFDYLDYEHRELLIIELDKKYDFLNGRINKNNKMF
jgi:hypothetical protein